MKDFRVGKEGAYILFTLNEFITLVIKLHTQNVIIIAVLINKDLKLSAEGKCENIFFLIAKKLPSPDNKFFLHTAETAEKFKKS